LNSACMRDCGVKRWPPRGSMLPALASLTAVTGCWSGSTPAAEQVAVHMSAWAPLSDAWPGARISLAHFNHLYDDISVAGVEMGVVRIYARHPDYVATDAPDEGFACVDDAARAIVMLTREWRRNQDPELLRKIRRLSEFVLHLQNSNGYFNNFLRSDLSINTGYRTSVAGLNWWSWRALWGLEEALPLVGGDTDLTSRIRMATDRLVGNLKRDLPGAPPGGGDEAADAIVAMLAYFDRTGDSAVGKLVQFLADRLLTLQRGGVGTWPYGMFVSVDDEWHAWGNTQAYALLSAGQHFARQDYRAAALLEVDHFYPYLLKTGRVASIRIRRDGSALVARDRNPYPQIAYGVRPMVFAAMKAWSLTRNERYRILANSLADWLFGANDAHTPIYHPESGVTFDGIVSRGVVNRNSGAESTIEALMCLQALNGEYP
jgi:hypothetical protein